jgi:AcrR family transcriptional regulator
MLRSLRQSPRGHRHGSHGGPHPRGQPLRPGRRTAPDDETRQRLLDAGRELFSEDGFHRVTVRDICHLARANVAAVNYHFGDKFGLYMEILRAGIALMTETNEMARLAGEGKPPEEQLRVYINVFIERVAGKDRQSWLQKIMMNEMANPTPALDIVFEQVIQPRFVYVGGIVAALLRCPYDDPRVLRCVLSVFGQCQVYLWNHLRDRIVKDRPFTPEHIDELSNHVFEFSLAGIRALATPSPGLMRSKQAR